MSLELIITDCDHTDIEIETNILKKANVNFELMQCKTEDDLINNCKEAKVFINQYAPVTRKVMENLPNLKLVVRYGVGVNNVDLVAAKDHGVAVCNVPDYGMNEVADQAMALMLELVRQTSKMSALVKSGVWDYQKAIPIYRISGKRIGIFGIGRIGTEMAKRASGFGLEVVAYDPQVKELKDDRANYIKLVSKDELLKTSDLISIHCPADNNIDLISTAEFKQMKNTVFIVNTARGGIINEKALLHALENDEIAGAGLDTTETEPVSNKDKLYATNKFVCTPHMGWYSEESALELKRKVAEESVRFLKGEALNWNLV